MLYNKLSCCALKEGENMHSYLRTVGFSNIKKKKDVDALIQEIIKNPDKKNFLEDCDGTIFAEYSKNFSENIGICVRGELTDQDKFEPDYYYPYFIGDGISTEEKVEIEKHAEKESYAGVCDEIRIGVTLIFYLQNMIDHLKRKESNNTNKFYESTTLSALSIFGKILLPIFNSDNSVTNNETITWERNKMIAAARDGDEDAIENLTLEDIDTYSMLSRRIVNEDVLSIVDSYFMPYGIESDQYNVLGEILEFHEAKNSKTNEEMYVLKICSNDLVFNICINKEDLLGLPSIGRRFKGVIWMQGFINYMD